MMATQPVLRTPLASELFALANSDKCFGEFQCHWCGSPCTRRWVHTDRDQMPFMPKVSTALHPRMPFACAGCWLWRRERQTINFLDGGYKDARPACAYSWWLTASEAVAIRKPLGCKLLYKLLLKAPRVFCLALLEGDNKKNYPERMVVNGLMEVKKDTRLTFTVNGVPFHYTIYELEEGLKKEDGRRKDTNGMTGGVKELIGWLGHPEDEPALKLEIETPEEELEKKKIRRGRPTNYVSGGYNPTKDMVTLSGM